MIGQGSLPVLVAGYASILLSFQTCVLSLHRYFVGKKAMFDSEFKKGECCSDREWCLLQRQGRVSAAATGNGVCCSDREGCVLQRQGMVSAAATGKGVCCSDREWCLLQRQGRVCAAATGNGVCCSDREGCVLQRQGRVYMLRE